MPKPILSLCIVLFSFFPLFALAETNLTFKGDFRFRNEQIKEEQIAPLPESDQARQRIRVRIGATAKVNEKSEVTVRLATGSAATTDGNTTNQTLTDYDSKKGIFLDQAFFNFKAGDSLRVLGGKTPLNFYFAGGSDLIFDADLTPEGLALRYKTSVDDSFEIFANAESSWLAERYSATGATDNTDVGLLGLQIGAMKKIDDYSVTLAVASYHFSNVKGAVAPAAKGNTLTAGAYANNYFLTVGDLELGTTLADIPVALFYEVAANSEGGDYKNAYDVGLKVGKLKEVDSWAGSIDYRELEKDSTLGVIAESDSSGGGTDMRSTRLSVAYQIAENANFTATVFSGKRLASSTVFSPNYSRLQLDANFYF